jgi:hypothetical protein
VVPIREIAAARIILFDFQNLPVCLAMTDPIGYVIANRQLRGRHCESPFPWHVIANRRQKRQARKELPAMWQSPEKNLKADPMVIAAINSHSEDCRGFSAIPIAIGTRNSSH